jgi:hypothetical protein
MWGVISTHGPKVPRYREHSRQPRHKEHRGSRDEPPRKMLRREDFHGRVPSAAPKPQSAEHRQLAMKYNRCFGFGIYVARGQVESHKKKCKRSQEAFGRRMAQLQTQKPTRMPSSKGLVMNRNLARSPKD